jgi:hypothetical protein
MKKKTTTTKKNVHTYVYFIVLPGSDVLEEKLTFKALAYDLLGITLNFIMMYL